MGMRLYYSIAQRVGLAYQWQQAQQSQGGG